METGGVGSVKRAMVAVTRRRHGDKEGNGHGGGGWPLWGNQYGDGYGNGAGNGHSYGASTFVRDSAGDVYGDKTYQIREIGYGNYD